MTKVISALTIAYDKLGKLIDDYTEMNDEAPYGLIIDNMTVWDLIGALRGPKDADALNAVVRLGPAAFDDTPLRGMEVLVKIGPRRADLVDENTFKLEKCDKLVNKGRISKETG